LSSEKDNPRGASGGRAQLVLCDAAEGLKVLQGWADQVVEMSKDGRLVKYFAQAASVAIDVGTSAAKGLNVAWNIAKVTFTQMGNLAKGTWLGIQSGATLAFVNICESLNTAGNYIYAALQVVGRVFRMIFNGVSSTVAMVFAGVVNTVIGAVNVVIKALNKIPGVDLGLVQKPKFVEDIEAYAREAGDKACRDLQAITSGQDFKDAKVRARGSIIPIFKNKKPRPDTGVFLIGRADHDGCGAPTSFFQRLCGSRVPRATRVRTYQISYVKSAAVTLKTRADV